MDFVKIISSIEKIFRYFLTGIAFSFIYYLSKSSSLEITPPSDYGNIIYLYILAVGMSIYSIHRLIYFITIDWVLFKLKWSPVWTFEGKYFEGLGKFHKKMSENDNTKVTGYYFYRLSMIHYVLILSEITWLLYPFSNNCSILIQYKSLILISSIIIYLISLFNYYLANRASKVIYE